MGYIHSITVDNQPYLIEPLLYDTAGGTASALTVDITNFSLVAGAYVNVKVGTINTNATLNVNNTGAKGIYYNGSQVQAGMLTENNIYTFIYDGTHWVILGDITGQNIVINTTSSWTSQSSFVAPRGTIVIYSDRGTVTETINGTEITKTVPGIKIGDGSTPIIDLAFVGDDVAATIRSEISTHVNNTDIHITAAERTKWNNKLNCDDTVTNHNLILTRN